MVYGNVCFSNNAKEQYAKTVRDTMSQSDDEFDGDDPYENGVSIDEQLRRLGLG